jgi:hypothetical protein
MNDRLSAAVRTNLSALQQIASDISRVGIQSPIKNARSLANEARSSTSTLAEVTGNVTRLTGASAITIDVSDTITVSDGTTTATYTHAAGQDVQNFLDAVNNTANLNVEARLTSDGRIQLEAAEADKTALRLFGPS